MSAAVSLRSSPTRAPATAQVALKIPVAPELRDAIARAAVQSGRPMTAIIRAALCAYLGEPAAPARAAEPEDDAPTRGAAEPESTRADIREPE